MVSDGHPVRQAAFLRCLTRCTPSSRRARTWWRWWSREAPDRPHFVGGAWIRIGSETVRATGEMWRRLVSEAISKVRFLRPHEGRPVTVVTPASGPLRNPSGEQRAARTLIEVNEFYVRVSGGPPADQSYALSRVEIAGQSGPDPLLSPVSVAQLATRGAIVLRTDEHHAALFHWQPVRECHDRLFHPVCVERLFPLDQSVLRVGKLPKQVVLNCHFQDSQTTGTNRPHPGPTASYQGHPGVRFVSFRADSTGGNQWFGQSTGKVAESLLTTVGPRSRGRRRGGHRPAALVW
jgi:hypothetical protein